MIREDEHENQYCKFHYPFALERRTYLRYKEVPRKGEKHFRVEIVAQRNDPSIRRHQRVQLQ